MLLVLFDIDGTLTQTNEVDSDCFVQAVADVCGFQDIDTDWTRYRNVTDAGIFQEIFQERKGRLASAEETAHVRERFAYLLQQEAERAVFSPVEGTAAMLSRLAEERYYHVSLATGAWSNCALVKMAGAGLNYADYPAASSDDATDRVGIMKLAMERAVEHYGPVDHAVYVGDGVWDARASRELNMPFIGIGKGAKAQRLVQEGAVLVMPDYLDLDVFIKTLGRLSPVSDA